MKRVCLFIILVLMTSAGTAFSLEKGALLYHSSQGDTLYGRTDALVLPCSPIDAFYGALTSGHAGLYIGGGEIIHAKRDGVVEEPSENFITREDLDKGCRYVGAKLPVNYDDPAVWPPERKDQIIVIAREQLGKDYDFTFHRQKGNGSGDFTCVGLVEYVYEEVGYDVTPGGYYATGAGGKTYAQTYNCAETLFQDWTGINSFTGKVEFSRVQHPLTTVLKIPLGREYEGERYIFFPYSQYRQPSTVAVPTDIPVSGGASGSGGGGSCFIATVSPDRITSVSLLIVLFSLVGFLAGVYRSRRSGNGP